MHDFGRKTGQTFGGTSGSINVQTGNNAGDSSGSLFLNVGKSVGAGGSVVISGGNSEGSE